MFHLDNKLLPMTNSNNSFNRINFSGRLLSEGRTSQEDENKVMVPAFHEVKMVLIRLYNQEINETFKIYQP